MKNSKIPRWAGRSFNVGVHKVRVLWGRVLLGSAALAFAGLAAGELTAFQSSGLSEDQSSGRVIACFVSARPTSGLCVLESPTSEPPLEAPGEDLKRILDEITELVDQIQAPRYPEVAGASLAEEPEQFDYELTQLADELKGILDRQEAMRQETRTLLEEEE